MGVGELVGVAGTLAVGELAVVAVVVVAEVAADGLVGGPTEPIRLPPLRISGTKKMLLSAVNCINNC